MVGPSLLVAPVTADRGKADGAAGQPTPVSVYRPEGPLYLKAGATIPFNLRSHARRAAGTRTRSPSRGARAG